MRFKLVLALATATAFFCQLLPAESVSMGAASNLVRVILVIGVTALAGAFNLLPPKNTLFSSRGVRVIKPGVLVTSSRKRRHGLCRVAAMSWKITYGGRIAPVSNSRVHLGFVTRFTGEEVERILASNSDRVSILQGDRRSITINPETTLTPDEVLVRLAARLGQAILRTRSAPFCSPQR